MHHVRINSVAHSQFLTIRFMFLLHRTQESNPFHLPGCNHTCYSPPHGLKRDRIASTPIDGIYWRLLWRLCGYRR